MTGPLRVAVLYGDLRTGRIHGEIDATSATWAQVLNQAGAVDQVAVPDAVIRALDLRRSAPAARTFLGVEVGGRIVQAGPIWSRVYDWAAGQVVLGAGGLWSLFDHRKVVPVLAAGQRVQDVSTTLTGADYGELARALVAQALGHAGGSLPLVLPAARPGSARTETWEGWKLANLGEQLRQYTSRQDAPPDIRFTARRRSDDARFLEWVMETGTETAPLLVQGGADWVLDTTTRMSPVLGIGTDEDGTVMGMRGWVTGQGSEAGTLIGVFDDPVLPGLGWPLLEVEETRSTVSEQGTVDGYAAALVGRSARPPEVWRVSVSADAVAEVQAGDFCRVVVAGHSWLEDGETRMRVQKVSGDLSGRVVLDMYPLSAVI